MNFARGTGLLSLGLISFFILWGCHDNNCGPGDSCYCAGGDNCFFDR